MLSDLKEKELNSNREEICINLALKLEQEIFSKFKHGRLYAEKARFILFNLKSPNSLLKTKLLSGELSPEEAIKIDAKKLRTDSKKKVQDEMLKRCLEKNRSDW